MGDMPVKRFINRVRLVVDKLVAEVCYGLVNGFTSVPKRAAKRFSTSAAGIIIKPSLYSYWSG